MLGLQSLQVPGRWRMNSSRAAVTCSKPQCTTTSSPRELHRLVLPCDTLEQHCLLTLYSKRYVCVCLESGLEMFSIYHAFTDKHEEMFTRRVQPCTLQCIRNKSEAERNGKKRNETERDKDHPVLTPGTVRMLLRTRHLLLQSNTPACQLPRHPPPSCGAIGKWAGSPSTAVFWTRVPKETCIQSLAAS